MLATAGMPSGAISSSRISSIESVDSLYSGIVWPFEVDVGPEHEPGGVGELAGVDQVVEVRVDHVRVLVEVLEHHDAAVGLDLVRGAEAAATSVRQPPTIGASATPSPTVSTYGSSGSSGTRPSGSGLKAWWNVSLGDLGQLVLLAREAQEGGAVERDPVAVLGERQVERGDVAVAAEDARVAERVPVDVLVQPRRRRSRRRARRTMSIPGSLSAHCRSAARSSSVPGEVAVDLAVVGAEAQRVAAALEVVRRLLDPGPLLRRARRRDDGDRAALGQRGWLDPHDGGGADMTSTRWPAGSLTNQRGAFHALLPSCGSKPC